MDAASPPPPEGRQDFEVAVICALPEEADAVLAVLDEELPDLGSAQNDDNTYTLGVLGKHNVVVVHMPDMGNVSSAGVAGGLRNSFPNINLALVVGICGGVPQGADRPDIFLGDLIISTAVIGYDFGRLQPTGFERKDTLEANYGRPSPKIRGILAKLATTHYSRKLQGEIVVGLQQATAKNPEVKYPGATFDRLYRTDYLHKHRDRPQPCADCDADKSCFSAQHSTCDQVGCSLAEVIRSRAVITAPPTTASSEPVLPAIHLGRIGSGNAVIRSGVDRDAIASGNKIIAFEMEGAGFWDQLPSIVIKGVCDYSDSHKGRHWRKYAGTVAAVGAKAFLKQWSPSDRTGTPVLTPAASRSSTFSGPDSARTSVIFNNHGRVGTQIGEQTIHGDMHHSFRF